METDGCYIFASRVNLAELGIRFGVCIRSDRLTLCFRCDSTKDETAHFSFAFDEIDPYMERLLLSVGFVLELIVLGSNDRITNLVQYLAVVWFTMDDFDMRR